MYEDRAEFARLVIYEKEKGGRKEWDIEFFRADLSAVFDMEDTFDAEHLREKAERVVFDLKYGKRF